MCYGDVSGLQCVLGWSEFTSVCGGDMCIAVCVGLNVSALECVRGCNE